MIEDQLTAAVGNSRGTAAADLLCGACVDLLDVDAAAISLIFDGVNAGTLGVSSSSARIYDELQFTMGEGPCLESVATRRPVLVPDLADPTDLRWPAYAPALLAHHIHGVHAIPVVLAGEYVGALDLFRFRPGNLNADHLVGALAAAVLCELPMLDLLTDDLRSAVGSGDGYTWSEIHTLTRVEVSQATGMLIEQLDIDPAEALVRLRAHAYATNRSASEVARDIVENGLRLDGDR